jgi:hypothetical protein
MLFLLWITSLIFTIAALLQPQQFTIAIISFILWSSIAILCTNITFIGFGGQNAIPYDINIGDRGDTMIIYIFYMLGVFMLLFGLGNFWSQVNKTYDQIQINPEAVVKRW